MSVRRNMSIAALARARSIKGQLFPFLTIVIILILVAVIAFINTSQVNLRKVSTMNAADAAALAGASQLANAANTIKDINANVLWANYLFEFTYLGLLPDIGGVVDARMSIFLAHALQNILTYLELILMGLKATQQAGGSAVQMTFGNMPVEEAAARKGSATGELQKSAFSQWLDNLDVYTHQTDIEYQYNWTQHSYNVSTDQQQAIPGEGINIKIKKPEENCLVLNPMPVMPVPTIFIMWIPPTIGIDGMAACIPGQLLVNFARFSRAYIWYDVIKYTLFAAMLGARTFEFLDQGYLQAMKSSILAAVYGLAGCYYCLDFPTGSVPMTPIETLTLKIPGFGSTSVTMGYNTSMFAGPQDCGRIVVDTCIFLLPIPYIASIENNDAEIAVEVTRLSPVKNLGLYQFEAQSITSGARAKMSGGAVSPFIPHMRYDAQVQEVWDGKKL